MKRTDLLPMAIVCAFSAGGLLFVACGGSDGTNTDLVTPDATSPDGDTTQTDGSTNNDGSTDTDGGTGDGATGSDGAARGPDGSFVADGGADPDGAGPGGNTTTISCGSTTCNIPGESCCVYTPNNPPPNFVYACVAGIGCPTPDGGVAEKTALKCSSQANCPVGTVCCVHQQQNTTFSDCQATCQGNNTAQLCDKNAPDGGGCPQNQPCSSNNIGDWNLPSSYATCGGKGN